MREDIIMGGDLYKKLEPKIIDGISIEKREKEVWK